jgi:hypothetical protein
MDDIMSFFEADAELQAAVWMLKEVTDLPESKNCEDGFPDKYSAQVFVYIQSIIKCKRKLKKSILKADKELLEKARLRLRKHFVTLDRDEQIKVFKYVQPD